MSVTRFMLLLLSVCLVVCGGYLILQMISKEFIGYISFIAGATLFAGVNLSNQENL